jgi:hypothetical protein
MPLTILECNAIFLEACLNEAALRQTLSLSHHADTIESA